MKQFYGSDNVFTDEAEVKQHQKLEKLYISTRAAKVSFCYFVAFFISKCEIQLLISFIL